MLETNIVCLEPNYAILCGYILEPKYAIFAFYQLYDFSIFMMIPIIYHCMSIIVCF